MTYLAAINRYPVKSLNGEALSSVLLTEDAGIPGDRGYAFAHDRTQFGPEADGHVKKRHLLNVMMFPRLAEFTALTDEGGGRLVLKHGERTIFEGNPDEPSGRDLLDRLAAELFVGEAKGVPGLIAARDSSLTDIPENCLSIINLESVRALGAEVGATIDPLRFRGNLHIEGAEAWAEREWQTGDRLICGEAEFSMLEPITRCAAINVDLATARREGDLNRVLQRTFDGNLMGIYATVEKRGRLAVGDDFVRNGRG